MGVAKSGDTFHIVALVNTGYFYSQLKENPKNPEGCTEELRSAPPQLPGGAHRTLPGSQEEPVSPRVTPVEHRH